MRHIVICGLPDLPLYLTNSVIFGKKFIEHKMYISIFYNFCPKYFFILRRTERGIIENLYWSSCIVHFILVHF